MNIQPFINRDKLIELTQQLIKIPTVNPPGIHYHSMIDFVIPELESIGMEVKTIDTDPDFPIVVGWINRGAKPELHFNGHYDVVPADENWTMPPFLGVVKENRVYGRGAADMKGGIASVIAAIDAVNRSGIALGGCVSFSLVPDEETGGVNGAYKLVQTDTIHPDMVIIPEPSFPRVLLGHKGVIQLLVKVMGSGAHAAMPALGFNAFERMIKLVSALIEHWNISNGLVESCRHLYPDTADIRILPTLTLGGVCSSGKAINSVPSNCTFSIDRRFMPIEDHLYVLRSLEEFIRRNSNNCEITRLLIAEASQMSHDEAVTLLNPLQDAINVVFGKKAIETISAGFMDTRFFRKRWKIPCLAYGPGDSGIAHIPDEYVSIDQMIQVSSVFYHLIKTLLI